MRHFDHVFWITLPSQQERHKHFARQIPLLGTVPVQCVEGVDSRALRITHSHESGMVIDQAGDGTIGCHISHMLVMRVIDIMGIDTALVLEDDVIICDDFLARLDAEISRIGQDWSALHLSANARRTGTHAYLMRGRQAGKAGAFLATWHGCDTEAFWRHNAAVLNAKWTESDLVIQNRRNLSSSLGSEFKMQLNEMTRRQIAERTYSQYGEDIFVTEFFAKEDPLELTFLEIGALDGIKDSNCRKLALIGWKGVCVEPNPYHFVMLHKNYRGNNRITLCALVGCDPEIRVLHLNNDGLATSSPTVFEALHDRVYFPGFCNLATVTPEMIVKRFGNTFDFVSIDAEGMDAYILSAGAPFLSKTRLLCIEKSMPGKPDDPDYKNHLLDVARQFGLSNLIYETNGNILISR